MKVVINNRSITVPIPERAVCTDSEAPKNFGRVSPCLYRGGWPTSKQLNRLQQNYGVKNLVTLQSDAPGELQRVTDLQAALPQGMQHHVLTVHEAHSFISAAEVIASLSGVTYVHCSAGANRTGKTVLAVQVLQYSKSGKVVTSKQLRTWIRAAIAYGFDYEKPYKAVLEEVLSVLATQGKIKFTRSTGRSSTMFFRSIQQAEKFSNSYNVPLVDVLMMGLNMMGTATVGFDTSITNRGRFKLTPRLSNWPYFFAVTLDQDSPFCHDGKDVWLSGEYIGAADPVHPDTCAETYVRKEGKALTLNSNSRSTCRGCKFCGTSSLVPLDFTNLLEEDNMRATAESFLQSGLVASYTDMESIGVVTGCFRTDALCLEHLLMVQRVFGSLGFTGEIRYIGSQIKTKEAVAQLADAGHFALYSTVECFERRDLMMKRLKHSVQVEKHLDLLGYAKEKGLQTCMLYILGLDSLDAIGENFLRFVPVLTRHPLVNLLQVYLPHHAALRDPAAQQLDYYLQARKVIETIFAPTLRPFGYDNYRSPWYSTYADEAIQNLI